MGPDWLPLKFTELEVILLMRYLAYGNPSVTFGVMDDIFLAGDFSVRDFAFLLGLIGADNIWKLPYRRECCRR